MTTNSLKIKLNEKKNFIFDMDGTLINLEKLNHQSYKMAVENHYEVKLDNDKYQRYFSGRRTAAGFEAFAKGEGIEDMSESREKELIKEYRSHKRDNLKNKTADVTKMIKGAQDYLEMLKENGKRLVLATSTIEEFAMFLLDHYKLTPLFEFVLTAEDVENGKPNPEIYNTTVSKLDTKKEDCVIFEDSKSGIQAGLNSDVLTVGVKTEGLNDEFVDMADFVIEGYTVFLN
ncbi:HAD-IA family hydrolase [Candidatus Dojkabacteria bacterium]|nr:HAD-IA family hydrolase [Candidatus Dojkabacteria bacterium]